MAGPFFIPETMFKDLFKSEDQKIISGVKPIWKHLERIPIWNYWHAQKDLRFLHMDVHFQADADQHSDEIAPLMGLAVIWEGMQEQYLQAFGYGDNAAKMLDLRLKRLKFQIKYDQGDKSAMTFVLIAEKEIENLQKIMDKPDIISLEDAVAAIEEHRKVQLDPHTTTAKQFFSYNERLVNYAKRQETERIKRESKARK